MTLCLENVKVTIRKLLELTSEFGKVAGYKINTQKSTPFLYTNNERSEIKIMETSPFTITSKTKQNKTITTTTKKTKLGINLPNETKDLHSENCKMLMKEIKDVTNR